MVKIVTGVEPKSLLILAAAANVAEEMRITIFVTAGNDKQHMKGSLHYVDRALDFRSKNFPNKNTKELFMSKVLIRLGKDYEGFLEDEGKPNEHFHIEHDPKIPNTVKV